MSPFYNMQARSITGEEIRFGHFRGQVVLIVNTASACGFTPQYAGLNELYTTFTKFLLNRSGQPIARYAPNKKPERLCKAIEKALQENC